MTRNRSGSSLMEALFLCSLTGGLGVLLLRGFSSGAATAERAGWHQEALLAARQEIEALVIRGPDGVFEHGWCQGPGSGLRVENVRPGLFRITARVERRGPGRCAPAVRTLVRLMACPVRPRARTRRCGT